MNLELFVLGTGGMMPLPGRFLTSVLLRREGELFLFDSGEGTQVSLRKLNLKWKKISAIFISHTHADHVTGLPGILMLSSQVERDEPLYIFGPPRIKEYVEMNKKVLDMYINYEIIVKEITGPEVVYKGDGFIINAFPLKHTKPCIGYSLVEEDRSGIFYPEKAILHKVPMGPLWSELQKGNNILLDNGDTVFASDVMGDQRSGRKVSFITDTQYFSEISDFVKDSDLLICEGMFKSDLEESALKKRHMTSAQAGRISSDAGGVKKLGLIHYSPRYTKYELIGLLEEAKAIFPNTFLTKDGQQIEIPYID
jgi:ribonuclease Z